MRWVYAQIGVPMWEWTTGAAEQSVMFYDADGDASCPPPMSDADWRRLEQHIKAYQL